MEADLDNLFGEGYGAYMRAKNAAKEIFDAKINVWINLASNGLQHTSVHTSAGAVRKGDVNKQVEVVRESNREPNSEAWEETVRATVSKENLGHGSGAEYKIWTKIRQEIEKWGTKDDHVGHIIGVMLGGPGTKNNLVPMRGRLNLSEYSTAECKIYKLLFAHEDWTAEIEVKLIYDKNEKNGERPYAINMHVNFWNGKREKTYEMIENFDN